MNRQTFADRWAGRLGPKAWKADAPLAPLTTFGLGGPAEWLAEISDSSELQALLAEAAEHGVPVTILGGGSNVLVSDSGVRGVVVRLRLSTISQISPAVVRAGAGVTMNGLVRWTIGRGLAGLEAWAGTPGTVGGAIYGNAHWGRRNIGDLVVAVGLVDAHGRATTASAEDMEFEYDTSRLKRTKEVVTHVDFRVAPGEAAALRLVSRESLHYRKATQPLSQSSAGCIFQNPGPSEAWPDGVPRSAGALVDRAGLKGHRIGMARISERHANFFVNEGGATAADMRALIELARSAVRDRFGVELKDEIIFLGSFEHG